MTVLVNTKNTVTFDWENWSVDCSYQIQHYAEIFISVR